jgi:hypothetical protein
LFSLTDKYQIVARAPYWKVTTFNPTSKLGSDLSLKEWRSYIAQLSDGWAIVSMPDSRQESVELAGLQARRVSTTIKGRKLGWPATFDARPFIREDAYYYSGTDVPFEAAMLVNALFDQESAPELVLGLALVQPNGKSRKQVWTDSCETVDLPPKFFESPLGMKEVALAQVFGNVTVKQSEIKDMIDGVGIGKDLGSPNHKH